MYNFWVVMKLELRLIWRNWITWLMVLVMLIIGAVCASNNRNEPWSSWAHLGTTSLFISLMLTFCTGNQINRDREQRLDGIVLSTPLATPSYVLGKYFAGLASLLLLAGSGLLSALLMDRFSPGSHAFLMFAPAFYPPLGAQPYFIGWTWLQLPAIIFGATFMLACLTLTRGQRVIAYIAAILIWLLPLFLTQSIPQLLDITANVFFPSVFSLGAHSCHRHRSLQPVPDSAPGLVQGRSTSSQSRAASHAFFSGRDTAFYSCHVSLEPTLLPGSLPGFAHAHDLWHACSAPSCLMKGNR